MATSKNLILSLAFALSALPIAAQAAPSTCGLVGDHIECDLYESGGNASLALPDDVGPGDVLVQDVGLGTPDDMRDLLRFLNTNDPFDTLEFYFVGDGALPTTTGYSIARTGAVTTYDVGNIYRVHHDGTVPEPATLSLFAMGALGLAMARRRSRK